VGRAKGHVGIILSMVNEVGVIVILLKLYGLDNWYFITMGVVILIFSLILMGHIDLKYGIAEKESALSNKYNPELMKILENTKK